MVLYYHLFTKHLYLHIQHLERFILYNKLIIELETIKIKRLRQ